ncbi:MAG: ornithine carbamoyltransferase [Candidatus Omnitrophica bacterium]|jgi:ornithine carbamoyltransferase|nr:ornithine carbamoyltransferase [Candidatus Omnitrophota bacterium]
MKKDLISIKDLSSAEINQLFDLTAQLKRNKNKFSRVLSGKTLALIFQKPSNRTRVSFEVGMYQLGGNSIYLSPGEINLGVRESIPDAAKTLSRYVDGIVLRTFAHKNVIELAKYADIPVINGLSDFSHPCQALADIYTVVEKLENVKGKTLAYVGDGNNVCNSLLFICAKTGMNINVAAPVGYKPDRAVVEQAENIALPNKSKVSIFSDPLKAVKGSDVIYTDVWTSMGQEKEALNRLKAFKGFQINQRLLAHAKKGVLVMHCLPAHRGEEITGEVMDSKNSVVFDQAENRMHVQKAVLIKLLKQL